MENLTLREALQAGLYNATLENVEEVDTKFGAALKFIYRTDDGGEASELVNKSYSPKSKLGKRVLEMTGHLPPNIYPPNLVGSTVTITLVDGENEGDFCKIVAVKRRAQSVQPAGNVITAPPAEGVQPQAGALY